MQSYQIEKYYYTRTKNIVPTDTGNELFLFASLIKETNQPVSDGTREKVQPIVSKLIEESLESTNPVFLKMKNDTVMYEIPFVTFKRLEHLAESDVEKFFLYAND